jgi:hypothetical protein
MIMRTWEKFPLLMQRSWGIPETGPTGAVLLGMTLSALADGVALPSSPHSGKPDAVQVPKGTPMEHIMFNVEGWASEASEEEAEQHVRGDLEQDYKTNPQSTVRETMTTYIVQTDPLGQAEWQRATSMFHKDDGGVIVWHDVRIDDSEDGLHGGIDTLLDVMMPFVTRENLA